MSTVRLRTSSKSKIDLAAQATCEPQASWSVGSHTTDGIQNIAFPNVSESTNPISKEFSAPLDEDHTNPNNGCACGSAHPTDKQRVDSHVSNHGERKPRVLPSSRESLRMASWFVLVTALH